MQGLRRRVQGLSYGECESNRSSRKQRVARFDAVTFFLD